MTTVLQSTGSRSSTGPVIFAVSPPGCAGPVSVRWRSSGPDGPVVDALLEAGLTVFVIAPNQVKNLRSRYGSAGNKDDRFDAFVLADTLRTDRNRLRPLTRDSDATVSLRMTVRARKDLINARIAMANQLRAHLQITLPGAIGLFRDIDSAITLAVPDPLPEPGQGRLALRAAAGELAAVGRATTTSPTSTGSGLTCTTRPAAPPANKHTPARRSPWRSSPR